MPPDTAGDYLAVLRRLFVVWEQGAFNPGLRPSVRVGKKPKRHLADPSLSAAALGMGPHDLIGDLNTFSRLCEALCERDLAVYSQSLGGTLLHYRDAQNREIDAVVELAGGVWGAFEIRLGANQIEEAAAHLLTMRSLMERDATARPPAVLVVICDGGSAHSAEAVGKRRQVHSDPNLTKKLSTRESSISMVPPTGLEPVLLP